MSELANQVIIAPSLLAGDFAALGSEANRMLDEGADWLHIDVMDGHFVPNLTIGAPVVKSLRKHTTGYLDCHLMVSHPEQWLSDFHTAGANGFTFHIEASSNPKELCQAIRATEMRVGVAIKPRTQVESVAALLDANLVDLLLVMTVEPGFGGQGLIVETLEKVKYIREHWPTVAIEVDGGVNLATIEAAANAGANVIVAGTAVVAAQDPKSVMHSMRDTVTSAVSQRLATTASA